MTIDLIFFGLGIFVSLFIYRYLPTGELNIPRIRKQRFRDKINGIWKQFRAWICRRSTIKKREGLIAQALSTREGIHILAESMVEPIRRSSNYQGLAEQILTVDDLPQGAYATLKERINQWFRDPSNSNVINVHISGEYLGSFPIRQDITVWTSDDERRIDDNS